MVEIGRGVHSRISAMQRLVPHFRPDPTERCLGQDLAGDVGVEVDASGWLLDVEIFSADENLRCTQGLCAAISQAASQALLAVQLRGVVLEGADRDLEPLCLEAGRIRPHRLFDGVEDAHRSFLTSSLDAAPLAEPPPEHWVVSGASDSGEVAVFLRWASGLERIAADPRWLERADEADLTEALGEAFDRAYETGETLV